MRLVLSLVLFAVLFFLDQSIKTDFVNGYFYKGYFIDLSLVFNHGIAFSMFSEVGSKLKYIQLIIVLIAIIFLIVRRDIFRKHYISISILFAGGLSNINDRFTYGGVVDYVHWHYLFNFAIFNLADVMIDFAIVLIIIVEYYGGRTKSSSYNF